MAHTFKDTEGAVWTLKLNYGVATRVKDICGINLLDLIKSDDKGKVSFDAFGNLLQDPFALLGVLFVMVEVEAKARNITEETFPDRFDGDTMFAAVDAFTQEYVDFFPNPTIRENLRVVFKTSKEAAEILQREATEKVKSLTADQMVSGLKKLYGIVPESSESIPTPTP